MLYLLKYIMRNENLFLKRIFENLFLDKKRISKYPRYIKILNIKKLRFQRLKILIKQEK